MSNDTPKKHPHKRIIITGITEKGETFRPSDWAERMSGSLCTFRGHRVVYSPLLQPMVKSGDKCVIIDSDLEQSNPELFQSLMDFARANKLRIEEENADDDSSSPEPEKK